MSNVVNVRLVTHLISRQQHGSRDIITIVGCPVYSAVQFVYSLYTLWSPEMRGYEGEKPIYTRDLLSADLSNTQSAPLLKHWPYQPAAGLRYWSTEIQLGR